MNDRSYVEINYKEEILLTCKIYIVYSIVADCSQAAFSLTFLVVFVCFMLF